MKQVQVRIGSNPEFDRAVAVRIMEIAAEAKTSLSYTEVIKGLNSTPALVRQHPSGLFLAGTCSRNSYIYTILSILQNQDWLKAGHNSTVRTRTYGHSDTKNYSLTDAGIAALQNKDAITLQPEVRKK